MLILSLDTSTMASSVAIVSETRLLAELTVQTRLTHSETLLPHIEQVLKLAGVSKGELAGIAVSIGPGSFTGLRIGLATAKGMAYALHVPIIGCSTLEALAYHYPVPGIYIAALLDAQKGNAYAAFYCWENEKLKVKESVRILSVDEVLEAASRLDGPVILSGDIVQKQLADRQVLPQNVHLALPHLCMPRAANTGMLGISRLKQGEAGNVMDMEPVYIRRSEAEVLWEARHRKADL